MNFFSSDWLETHGRIEIFCQQDQVDNICKIIRKAVGTVESSNSFIALMPVEKIFSLSTISEQ
tara:strand:+ start:1421 stop:1609 length:189 start_codon:yes stop_codon:yes gene_type:complete